MHMPNLSSMGVLDTPAIMRRFVIAVSVRLTKIRVSIMQTVKLEFFYE